MTSVAVDDFRQLGTVPVNSRDDGRAAIAGSRRAQEAWGAASYAGRRRVLTHLLQHILDYDDVLCEVISRDSEKTQRHPMLG